MHRITIEATGVGQRGICYTVSFQGATLLERSRVPEFDACRALLAQGVTGPLEVWRSGTLFASMRLDIEAGARWTVTEGDSSPRFAPWTPYSADAHSGRVEAPPAVASDLAVASPQPA